MKNTSGSVLKLQLKMQLLITLPVMIMGLLISVLVFSATRSIMETSREQLKMRIASVEGLIQEVDARIEDRMDPDEKAFNETEKKKLANLRDELDVTIRLNSFQQLQGKRTIAFIISGLVFGFSIITMICLHRIIGPIFRLQKAVSCMVAGEDVGQIKVRASDELQELARGLESLRRYVIASRGRENVWTNKISAIIKKMDTIASEESSQQDKGSDTKMLLKELKMHLKNLTYLKDSETEG